MSDEVQGELFVVDSNEQQVTVDAVAEMFDPGRLTQARVLAEQTKAELAKLLGVSAAAVGQYESGISKPRADLIIPLAKILRVPMGFFAAGRPFPRLDSSNAHFRSLRSTRSKDRAKAAAHAEQVCELAAALEQRVRFPELDLPTAEDGTPPAAAAQRLRRAWQLPRGPVSHLTATAESRGVIVCMIPLTEKAVTRVKAYSTDALSRPLVIITPERFKSVYDFRFTTAHELGHLVMHPNPLPGDRQQEREADQFAAEFLTPRAEIEPLLPRTVRLAVLDQLSRTWGVSIESLIYRMGELRIASDVSIRRAHQRLAQMANFRRDEPLTSYPGEVPTLPSEAVELADSNGLSRSGLARQLCWKPEHLASVLGEPDERPQLRIVR